MHIINRHMRRLRYMKLVGDGDGGGGGSSPSAPSAAPTASSDAGVTPSPDGGGGATPSSPSPDSGADDSANPWDALGQSDFDTVVVDPVAPTPTPPATPPQAPVAPAQTTPPQPTTPAAQQPVVPAEPTTPQPRGEAPAADLSPSDPAGIADAIEANRNDVTAHLAQSRFQLSPEEVQELETDVTVAVPKLLAKVYVESQIAMQRFLAQAVPGMVQRQQVVSRANETAETQFFTAHEALGLDKANQQHRQAAVRVAKIYRQMNPQMPLEQLISDIGPMVAAAVKAQPRAATPQSVPQTPGVIQRGGVPFRPAINGGGGGGNPQPEPENPWAGLGQDFE
jgi:hypothetical protein